ncbi:hypothetical protein COU79_00760 [Candidatus Peregrinibacteria bacterium CG10_big_fil_rev_8_21_14_0_10_54_7]|nr:MAG: hypothetical protein COU79_00760 [Candidatus Peregrinibacteria bacterium CG10_big_fil_rev_8_21_14_0_10_54_7]
MKIAFAAVKGSKRAFLKERIVFTWLPLFSLAFLFYCTEALIGGAQAQTVTDGTVVWPRGENHPDFNNNGIVDFPDFIAFAGAFGKASKRYDLTGDGLVGFRDFLTFAGYYGMKLEVEPAQPTISQSAELKDFVDIKYLAYLEEAEEVPRVIIRNNQIVRSDTIFGPNTAEVFRDMAKGDYQFVVLGDTARVTIPNYLPEPNPAYWAAFDPDFTEGEIRFLSLEGAFSDKNVEDNPVGIREVVDIDDHIEVVSDSLGGYSITALKGGTTKLKIEFGSEEGGGARSYYRYKNCTCSSIYYANSNSPGFC